MINRQPLATYPDREGENGHVRLFRAVLAQALRDEDAHEWIGTDDAELVCLLADVDRDAVRDAITGPW